MLFYELVQVALGLRDKLSRSPIEKEWTEFFLSSQKQAIAGVVFSALDKLAAQGQRPPQKILFEWIGLSENIKAQNKRVNKRCIEITQLFAKAGFRSCILKGQGNALMYPDPLLRTSGDIDIWIDGCRKDIKDLVVSICPDAQDGDLHVDFPIYKDVPVEVHYKPWDANIPKYNNRLQKWFKEQGETQFTHTARLDDAEICIPTAAFNAVHQLSHIQGHFFVEGIGLRQFVDYFYVLKKIHEEGCSVNFTNVFDYLGLLKFARGVMWIEHEVLGLPVEYLICEIDEKLGKVILKEIEEGGNFGFHDQRYVFRKRGYLARGLVDSYRLLKLAHYFPQEALWKILRKVENQKWKV